MAETLELQQVICPRCKQVTASFGKVKTETECPYCHNKIIDAAASTQEVPAPELVMTFQTTEKDFKQALLDRLVEQDHVPADVFRHIGQQKVFKAYLPMYLYEGRYNASWTCEAAPIITQGKKQKVGAFEAYTGTSGGNFAVLCLGHENPDIPKELREFGKQYPYNAAAVKNYAPDQLGLNTDSNLLTLALDTDTESVWNKYGFALINNLAEQEALDEQLTDCEVKNFKVANRTFDLKHNGRYVWASFWFMFYTYHNEKHYFIMDGAGEKTFMSAPVDQNEMKHVRRNEIIKSVVSHRFFWLPAAIFICFWVFAGIAYLYYVIDGVSIKSFFSSDLLVFIYLAFSFLVGWLIAKKLPNFFFNKYTKNKSENSKKLRREAANKLG